METMLKKCLVVVCCAGLALSGSSYAQKPDELDFLKALTDFQQIRSMLPSYVNSLAAAQLRQRSTEIERISTKQDVEERRVRIREKMIQTLGGLPERTPLNARTAAVLEREDYKIEKVIFESQPRFY